jgi:tRNA dimethylallyltransferase
MENSCHHLNTLVTVLGVTASGKTGLAVHLAQYLGGEVISADSRQVFRGMDIGTGKDLHEYGTVPYHLIDILEAGSEFSVYDFQQYFLKAYSGITSRGKIPVLCGGTGLYLDAVLRGYRMARAPRNELLRQQLAGKSDRELVALLQQIKPQQHNSTDLLQRERTMRAIEIALAEQECSEQCYEIPAVPSLTIGIRRDRASARRRITERLHKRLADGMIAEVERLYENGVSWAQLSYYGLEYRHVSRYLQGMVGYDEMVQQLNSAIHDFAKRQDTWFRRLEKRGICIHWLDGTADVALQAEQLVSHLVRQV